MTKAQKARAARIKSAAKSTTKKQIISASRKKGRWSIVDAARITVQLDSDTAAADSGNPKDAYGEAKVDLSLVPPAASIYMALGFMNGAHKYGPYNWRSKKVKMMVYLAAAKRHIDKVIDGQDLDEESSLPEIGHALASLGIIADAIETGNIVDNRPPKGAAAALLNKWKKPTPTLPRGA